MINTALSDQKLLQSRTKKIKERKQKLQRPTNKKLVAEVYKAADACNIINRCATINDFVELENYFDKYRIIILGE